MQRLIELNPSIRKRMPPKRSGAPLFGEKPRRIRKPIFRTPRNRAIAGFRRPTINTRPHLHKLDRQKDGRLPISLRLQEIAMTPNLSPKVAMRLLEFCVHTGNRTIVHELLTRQTIDLKTFDGGKLLLQAIVAEREAIAATLMRHGADLSDRRAAGDESSLLHELVRSYRVKGEAERLKLVRLLLRCGADVDARDKAGYSVLHDAIVYEHCSTRLVDELLDHGARLTVDESCTDLNDIFLATCHKPTLLPRLIKHQVKDEETKSQRTAMAIDYLTSRRYTDDLIDTMQLIERILDVA